MDSGMQRIQTQPIRIMVTTDDHEIEGYMHIKPGGYQSRISDLLNAKELHFVPITEAVYRSLRHPEQPSRQAATLIIRLDTIRMVIPLDAEVKAHPGTEAPAAAHFG